MPYFCPWQLGCSAHLHPQGWECIHTQEEFMAIKQGEIHTGLNDIFLYFYHTLKSIIKLILKKKKQQQNKSLFLESKKRKKEKEENLESYYFFPFVSLKFSFSYNQLKSMQHGFVHKLIKYIIYLRKKNANLYRQHGLLLFVIFLNVVLNTHTNKVSWSQIGDLWFKFYLYQKLFSVLI